MAGLSQKGEISAIGLHTMSPRMTASICWRIWVSAFTASLFIPHPHEASGKMEKNINTIHFSHSLLSFLSLNPSCYKNTLLITTVVIIFPCRMAFYRISCYSNNAGSSLYLSFFWLRVLFFSSDLGCLYRHVSNRVWEIMAGYFDISWFMSLSKSVVSPHLFAYLPMKLIGDLFGSFQLKEYML